MSLWDLFFEELSHELGRDPSFIKAHVEKALERFIEEKAAHSLGLLSIDEGWILQETALEEEPLIFSSALDANPSTIRYLHSQVPSSQLSSAIQALTHKYPNEFITPAHIDTILH